MVPFILGLSPVALIVGATIGEHEARWAAWMGVWPIFSGNAHVATVRALHDAGAAVAILTGLAVNTRVAAYGFAVAARWQHQPRWFRLLAPCLLVDPTFAAGEHHAAHHPDPTEQRQFFLAAGLTLGVAFWALVTIGMFVGGRLDGGLGLDIAVPLCLVVSLGARCGPGRPPSPRRSAPWSSWSREAGRAGRACSSPSQPVRSGVWWPKGGDGRDHVARRPRRRRRELPHAVGPDPLARPGPASALGGPGRPPGRDLRTVRRRHLGRAPPRAGWPPRGAHGRDRRRRRRLDLATRKVSMLRVIVAGLVVYELASLALAAI